MDALAQRPGGQPLPPFPRPRGPAPGDARLADAGVTLRPAEARHLPALARIHALSRLPELLLAPWSPGQKQAFLDDQFGLQHTHFVRHFAKADFWVLTGAPADGDAAPIGRVYLDRSTRDWRLVDILLAPEAQGKGAGSALLDWIQRAAAAAGASGVSLHVAAGNPRAQALYRRFGFVDLPGGDGHHLPMRWTPGAA